MSVLISDQDRPAHCVKEWLSCFVPDFLLEDIADTLVRDCFRFMIRKWTMTGQNVGSNK